MLRVRRVRLRDLSELGRRLVGGKDFARTLVFEPQGFAGTPHPTRTQRRTNQTLARVDPKKTGWCPSGGVRGTHIRQPQPVEPPRFESKYLAARIPALGNSPHVPGP